MLIRRAFQTYAKLLHEKPWPTNIATTVISVGISDTVAQQLIERRGWANHYKKRTVHFCIIGGFITAPSLLIWYRILNKYIKSSSRFGVITKVLLDQAIFSPYILGMFLVSVDILDQKSVCEIQNRLKNEYRCTLVDSYKFWPFVQTVNFVFVPEVFRILFLRFSSVIWNSYLCWLVHRKSRLEDYDASLDTIQLKDDAALMLERICPIHTTDFDA